MSLISTSDSPIARPPPSWKYTSLNPSAMIPRICWSLVAGPGVAGVEEALRVLRGKVHGEPAEPSVVGRADRCGVAEPGPGLHRDPAGGGGLLLPALAHQWL